MDYVALRYFNVFGPRQDKNSQYAAIIPNFITALLEGERAVIYGDGEQTRNFVYVGDVVKANILACESRHNGVVNVAGGGNVTINGLYEIISDTLKIDINPKYLPERWGDIKYSLADVSHLVDVNLEINLWDFKKHLVETINWFKLII